MRWNFVNTGRPMSKEEFDKALTKATKKNMKNYLRQLKLEEKEARINLISLQEEIDLIEESIFEEDCYGS